MTGCKSFTISLSQLQTKLKFNTRIRNGSFNHIQRLIKSISGKLLFVPVVLHKLILGISYLCKLDNWIVILLVSRFEYTDVIREHNYVNNEALRYCSTLPVMCVTHTMNITVLCGLTYKFRPN